MSNTTDTKTWGRTETGEVYHSFHADFTGICRKNVAASSDVQAGRDSLITEAKVDEIAESPIGYRKCANCAKKEQAHRDRKAASLAPATEAHDLGGVATATEAPKYDGQGGIDRDQQAEDLATASAEENAAVEIEAPAETVDMDDLHTQALVEDFQRRTRAMVRNVNATITGANLATSLHQAAQSLRELADALAQYREPVRTEFEDADDALEYLTQFTWEPTSENLTRDPDVRVTVRRVYPPEGSIGTRQVMSVGYDITERGSRGRLITSSSACYLDSFLIWYRPVQDTTT